MAVPALSVAHYRAFVEGSIGPLQKLVESMSDSPERLEVFRREFETLCEPYFDANVVAQESLLTRAAAR
jgi:hypothetical protein